MSAWPSSVGLVGCGAMGRAMAAGIVRARPDVAAGLRLADAVPQAAALAAEETGGSEASLAKAAACDLVILAVKPKDAPSALQAMGRDLSKGAVLLSVVAGLSLADLARAGGGAGVARTMPNLAVRLGAGLVVVATLGIEEAQEVELMVLLDGLGAAVALPESLFGAATGLAGCGPGFVALVAEALEEGGVATGLTRPQARSIVQAVLGGTAALLAGGADPAGLRQSVSSPGGATIAGLGVLERGAVRAHLADAVRAAARRAEEL